MRVRDLLADARLRIGHVVDYSSDEEKMADLAIVAEGMSTIVRKLQPEVIRNSVSLDGTKVELHLPYPLLTVEGLFLDGVDLTNSRVAPHQMNTLEGSENV